MKFAIDIREVFEKTIIVEADDIMKAIEKAEEACDNDIISLNYEDLVTRDVFSSKYFRHGIVGDIDVSSFEHLKG